MTRMHVAERRCYGSEVGHRAVAVVIRSFMQSLAVSREVSGPLVLESSETGN